MIIRTKQGDIAVGTATKDAEYKIIGERETPLAAFSVAVNARGEAGAYVNCKAFGTLAGYARHIKKGDAVLAIGVPESREYNGKTYTDLICQYVAFIGKETVPNEREDEYSDLDVDDDVDLPY